jgi:multicomponent Na+:H+ antiporter subunit B
MIVALDLLVFSIVLVTAVFALRVKDLLTAVALLAGYSLFVALLFTGMLALDVALVEAALGAGLTGVLFIAAIMVTTRRSTASESIRHRTFVLVLVTGFLGLMLYASTGLPDRGDPDAPAAGGVSRAYLEGSLADTETPNVVTAVLADYRSQDTLGETLVIFTAALAAALVMVRREDEGEDVTTPLEPDDEGGAS